MTYERFIGTGEFGDRMSNRCNVQFKDAYTAFERTNAQRWIDEFRVCTENGRLDIEATAARVGVTVDHGMPIMGAHGVLTGLENGEPAVHLNPIFGEDEYAVTFGHELGHLFILTAAGLLVTQREDEVEQFCDIFGYQMALPLADLASIYTIDANLVASMTERYGVRYVTVIHQLMLAGKLPRRITIDSGVGEAKNPFYLGKVKRHVICIDCQIGKPHSTKLDLDDTPNFDLTAFEWAGMTPIVECGSEIQSGDPDEFRDLNMAYGRWTDADEALMDAERRDYASHQRLSRYVARDW